MVGRITVVAVGAAGVVVAGLSVASATLWRPDDVLRATVTTDSPYVVTAPGVVEMGGQPTTVTVTTPQDKKAPIVVAVGRDTDVVGWVGNDPHETVAGMTGWSALRLVGPTASPTSQATPAQTEPAQGEPADGGSAQAAAGYQSPAGSDMWVAQATGTGGAELKRWAPGTQYSGRWSVLVANPTRAQMSVALAWPRQVSTPWLIPGLVLGLGAFGWAAYQELRRRGKLTFGAARAGATASGRLDDDAPPPRSRREARGGRSAPVRPDFGTAPVADEPTGGTTPARGTAAAALVASTGGAVQDEVQDQVAQEPPAERRFERALSSWSPARTWQRARHSVEPDNRVPEVGPDEPEPVSAASARNQPTTATPVVAAPPGPIQPPPAAPARPGTPAWSRAAAPPTSPGVAAPPTAPRPASSAVPEVASSRRDRRAWPPGRPQADTVPPSAPVETTPTRRSGPFGRGRPEPGPASSAPALGASQPTRPGPPPSGWVPGRGGRTGAVPQVPASAEPAGGRRPAWLGRTRSPSPTTGPLPTAAPSGTAPRLSAGPQPDPAPRGDAWRQIWGISPSDGHEEDQ